MKKQRNIRKINILKCRKRTYMELSQELTNLYGEEATLENASKEQLYSVIWSWSKKKAIAHSRFKDTEILNRINGEPFEGLPGFLFMDNLMKLDLLLDVNEILRLLGYSIEDMKKMGKYEVPLYRTLSAAIQLELLHRSLRPELPKWKMPVELRKKTVVLNPWRGRKTGSRREIDCEVTRRGRKTARKNIPVTGSRERYRAGKQ